MAEVWRAEVSYTEDVSKIVALKMIREDLSSQKQFRSLFIDEARITSRISHTNVAQVLDFGDENGHPFLAIELVHGADLFSLMAAAGEQMRTIPLDVAAFIVAEVARGLDHAHRLVDEEGQSYGIVHRDVSPQNVLVSYAGEVKVTDFGIARARDKVTQTETGTVMGKFRYMSPEQVRGEEIDARSDIFSCGILLYELVTGKQLFNARTSAQVVDQIRYDELPELAASRPDVDPALDTVLRWTLERDLSKRCPDAATLARDLERYVHVAHPQFTRERVAELLESLMPRKVAQPASSTKKGSLAFAGTALAPTTGPEAKKAAPPRRPSKSLADLERDAAQAADGDPDPDTTAPAKRGAAPRARELNTVMTGPVENGVPSESMEGITDPPTRIDGSGDEPSHEETLTLARRKGISASGPVARDSAPPDAPTRMLEEDPDATGRTRARPPEPAEPAAHHESSDTATRTARPGSDAARRSSPARRSTKPRKGGRGVQATLGVVLALLLLGGVALLFMRKDPSKPGAGSEPGAPAMGAQPASADATTAAVTGDASATASDAGTNRVKTLDESIAALKPETILVGKGTPAELALLLRLNRRLAHATVNEQGKLALGKACGSAKALPPLKAAAVQLADLYAERILLDPMLPELVRTALTQIRLPAKPTAADQRLWDGLAALRVLLTPKRAPPLRALIQAHGRLKSWCPPLAGKNGQRYAHPHLVVARDAVARLLRLSPNNSQALLWRRFLEATIPSEAAKLGSLSLRLASSRRQVLKKDDNQVFFVTIRVKNTHPNRAVQLQAAGFRLHGVGAKPLVVGLWKPDLREAISPGKTIRLELTFAAPLGLTAKTLVLSAPRAGAGHVWLQVSTEVLQ